MQALHHHQQRHLLYHRGVDDSPGTYVSDYVGAGLMLAAALPLAVACVRRLRASKGEFNREAAEKTCANLKAFKRSMTPTTVLTVM